MELGGNNALIVAPSADLDMAAQSIFFGAVGTAGQRCTSTRRVIVHESVAEEVREQLLAAYEVVRIGNPLDRENGDGAADRSGVLSRRAATRSRRVKEEGGEVLYGGEPLGETVSGRLLRDAVPGRRRSPICRSCRKRRSGRCSI